MSHPRCMLASLSLRMAGAVLFDAKQLDFLAVSRPGIALSIYARPHKAARSFAFVPHFPPYRFISPSPAVSCMAVLPAAPIAALICAAAIGLLSLVKLVQPQDFRNWARYDGKAKLSLLLWLLLLITGLVGVGATRSSQGSLVLFSGSFWVYGRIIEVISFLGAKKRLFWWADIALGVTAGGLQIAGVCISATQDSNLGRTIASPAVPLFHWGMAAALACQFWKNDVGIRNGQAEIKATILMATVARLAIATGSVAFYWIPQRVWYYQVSQRCLLDSRNNFIRHIAP
ncbi:hypothetical protein EJ04DRAFT_93517 [Polyplosphaeria fusca]|uniref:Uncharacterized protein n=1 Tax=Polyplosphaeria fusca TaxID=682080 RepID=A0A9P4QNC8_9PLEO|nr:hypothetical protein EJ04DRAFT_93517 [Polyplosphaeria fusca]